MRSKKKTFFTITILLTVLAFVKWLFVEGLFRKPTKTRRPQPRVYSIEGKGSSTSQFIKGNINKNGEKIYHVPGGAFYEQTIIDPSKGHRFFASEAEAIAAGWRRSSR